MARGQYWIHPALTEVVENALLKLELAAAEDLTTTPARRDRGAAALHL